MPYRFVITNLSGAEQGEAAGGSSAKRIDIPVCGMATSKLTLRADDELADFLLEGDALLKVYEHEEDGSAQILIGHHRLVTAEEDASDGRHTVAATFADPTWILFRRMVGKSTNAGAPLAYSDGTALATVDRTTLITNLLGVTNTESPTGIVAYNPVLTGASTYIEGWYFKRVAEGIAELGAALDGPDWRISPVEYGTNGAGVYGHLIVKPTIGQSRAGAAFEYGDGRLNVRGFKRAVSLEGTANRIWSLPAGFPAAPSGNVMQWNDSASQTARGLLEDVLPSDVTPDALRAGLMYAHLAARKKARQVITFDVIRDLDDRVPRLGVDFDVGDTVPFRASIQRNGALIKRINITSRIYGYGVSVDDTGHGIPALTTIPS